MDPEHVRDRLSAGYLVMLAGRIVHEVGALAGTAAAGGRRLPTLGIDTEIGFRSAEDRAAFADELTAAVLDLVARYHHDDGRPHRLVVAAHPKPENAPPRKDRTVMTQPNVPQRFELELVVPGTPEQVWDAIATADGISAWMMPTELDERLGGTVVFHMGDEDSRGTITGFEPPRRVAYEEDWATLGGQAGGTSRRWSPSSSSRRGPAAPASCAS